MTNVRVPCFEPEVIRSEANKHWRGDHEKVATTPLSEIIVDGVIVTSRYDKAHELETMAHMIEAVGRDWSRLIESIWCDSKCTNCYEVVMKAPINDLGARVLGELLTQASGGHNGILIKHGDDSFDIDPYWDEP